MFARIRTAPGSVVFAAILALSLFGACGGGEDTPETEPAADETAPDAAESPAEEEAQSGTLEFAGTEYAFSVPATVQAGPTAVTLVNNGEEPHMLDLVHLTDDAPALEELIKLPEKKVGKFFLGKPIHIETVKPGETSEAVDVDLKPGRYGYVCFYSEKKEKPHAFLGMIGQLTVE